MTDLDALYVDPPAPGIDAAAAAVVLAFADDELLAGQRHSEWLGLSPFLEEDLAYASIAQDELGHARALYALVWPDLDAHERDAMVVRRRPDAFRSAWLCELEPGAWERALVRHLLYDVAESLRWQHLESSSLPGLAGVAAKAQAEEHYHRRHAADLVVRLGQDADDARGRLQVCVDELWPLALSLFESTDDEVEAVAAGVLSGPVSDLVPAYRAAVEQVATSAGLRLPDIDVPAASGARQGVRHASFESAHAQMLTVFAYDPDARW